MLLTLIRLLTSPKQLETLIEIAHDYKHMLDAQLEITREVREQMARKDLEYARMGRAWVEQFLIYLENPEDDLRDTLISSLRDFDDLVARLEEHAPA